MNAADLFLAWLSERGTVSASRAISICMQTFGAGMEENAARMTSRTIVRGLAECGHLEWTNADRLEVVPTTLVRVRSGEMLIVGTRTDGTCRQVRRYGCELKITCQLRDPAIWRVSGREGFLDEIVKDGRFVTCVPRGEELMQSLPTFEEIVLSGEQVAVNEDDVEVFHIKGRGRRSWGRGVAGVNCGLCRDAVRKPARYFWKAAANDYRLLGTREERLAAQWFAAQGTVTLDYDKTQFTLRVSGRSPLPLLVERALRWGDGREPEFTSCGGRCYHNVTEKMATGVSELLGVELG